MNILYIYGWKSSPDCDNVLYMRENMPANRIISIEYDQLAPVAAIASFDRFIVENQIHCVVASSYGAFIAMNIAHALPTTLINPCMKPSVEIPKLDSECGAGFVAECQSIEERLFNVRNVNRQKTHLTSAFFSTNDELFSYKQAYLELGYRTHIDLVGEQHSLSKDGIAQVVSFL
jgi:predicted esterase YcpF (UPF0227 family)